MFLQVFLSLTWPLGGISCTVTPRYCVEIGSTKVLSCAARSCEGKKKNENYRFFFIPFFCFFIFPFPVPPRSYSHPSTAPPRQSAPQFCRRRIPAFPTMQARERFLPNRDFGEFRPLAAHVCLPSETLHSREPGKKEKRRKKNRRKGFRKWNKQHKLSANFSTSPLSYVRLSISSIAHRLAMRLHRKITPLSLRLFFSSQF